MELYGLQVEHLTDPLGIDAAEPRFSWKVRSEKQNTIQRTYRIRAWFRDTLIWDTGVVNSRECLNIEYQGETLQSRQRIRWNVSVTTEGENAEAWAEFEMGLLTEADWKAKWIEAEHETEGSVPLPSPYLRKRFVVREGLIRARAYQTAHGLYHFWMNGTEGSPKKFVPGNTSYYQRLQYQTDDITPFLAVGENVWAVRLGDGWWRGACGAFSTRNNYGSKLQFLGQLELEYADGSVEVIPTDESFVTAIGGLLRCDMKLGTVYDGTKEPNGWKERGFNDSTWANVHKAEGVHCNYEALIADRSVPVLEQETFSAKVFRDKAGSLVLDFGQNLAGYVRMRLRGCRKGQKIVLEHGERLNEGVFDFSNVFVQENSPQDDMFQTVVYYASGDEEEVFYPEFSVFGFQYVRLSGYPEENICSGDFTAIAVYSDLKQSFEFCCSNGLLTRLAANSLWSQKGNFLDVPTDCPTRERAAWTGDAQVYCKTAAEMMDVYSFFEKWMQDVSSEQASNGQVPSIVPSIEPHVNGSVGQPKDIDGSAGWGDAATIVPYTMYISYGDKQILKNQYDSAKGWVAYMIGEAKKKNPYYAEEAYYHHETDGVPDADYIWDTGFHWGEWSEPNFVMRTLPEDFFGERMRVGNPVVATAYLCHSARLLSKMADILGYGADAKTYGAYAQKAAQMYDKYLVCPDGSIPLADEGRQAAYVRVLAFGLCSEEKRPKVLAVLLKLIKDAGYHLNTGFLSTALLLNVLAEEGQKEAAYRILEQTTPPSWLFPITAGATTIFESWDGVQRFFGSFNHYSFGAVCDFLFSYVCGIQVDEEAPGYRHFYLRPVPGGSLEWAKGAYESPYGKIGVYWKRSGNRITYEFTVPANSTATVVLADGTKAEIGSGVYRFEGGMA